MKFLTLTLPMGALFCSLAALTGCGNKESDVADAETAMQGTTACDGELQGRCGAACDTDADCTGGQFCGPDGACEADCTPGGGQCTGTCTSSGRCESSAMPPGVAAQHSEQVLLQDEASPSGTASTATKCIDVVFGFEGVTPTVLVVVDRSGSMADEFDMNQNRWQIMRDTLINPATGLIKRLEADVRFGLMLYTSVNPRGEPSTVFDECPALITTPINQDNYEVIGQTYAGAELIPDDRTGGFHGHTPTGESLEVAATTLAAFGEPGPKAIILATDGKPDNCTDGDDHSETSEQISLNAVTTAFSGGIKTFVIGVGEDVNDQAGKHLKDLAVAGQGNAAAHAYSAFNTQELEAAFASIVGGIRSCSYSLRGSVPEAHASTGQVSLGGRPLAFGDPNGWALVGDNVVEIKGEACQELRGGTALVNIGFPCVQEVAVAK